MDISETQTPNIIIINDDDRVPPGPPHEALFLSLPYFTVRELLATSQVCWSLRRAVKNDDLLPWLNIVVEKPLSKRLCDDFLLRITSMARGKLRTLALLDCAKITDDGLSRVAQANPLLHKLLLPGCTRLTPEGVIKVVNLLSSSKNGQTLKKIHINGIYNVKKHHLETLKTYLQPQNASQRVIDVEICPKCDNVRLVFGCPRESCRTKPNYDCKGCGFCVPRCKECGVCVKYSFQDELEEVVCGDILCSDCWLRLCKCSFCNKPYCKQHGDEYKLSPFPSSGSSGFVCDFCQDKFISNFESL